MCDAMLEAARDAFAYDAVVAAGLAAVGPADVLDGVRELVDEVRLEVLLGDGSRLIVLVDPLGRDAPLGAEGPGAVVAAAEADPDRRIGSVGARRPQRLPSGRAGLVPLAVRRGQRAAVFDRAAAAGFRLDLPAGVSERWAPGEKKDGRPGPVRRRGRRRIDDGRGAARMTRSLTAEERLARYGPSAGDRIRLGDTDLWVRVAEDRQAPGDEPIWGYAKTLRPRMAQAGRASPSELDAVVAGALVIDPDDRRRQGRHRDQGRPDRRRRAGREPGDQRRDRAARSARTPRRSWRYGLIATPGAVDSHVHLISPELLPAALSGGVTTLDHRGLRGAAVGDGADARGARGLAAERRAPGVRPVDGRGRSRGAARRRRRRLQDPRGLRRVPGADRRHARVRRRGTASPSRSTPTASTSRAELEDTVAAIAGRTVHAYHVEGTGGGHVPDLLGLVREPNVICSSTTPTLPCGRAARRPSTSR